MQIKTPDFNRFKHIVSRFQKASVLVVGDLILDEFIWGSVSRISPEAPVPVVWVKSENFMPGGSCNVANNISAMGGKVHVMGIVGKDERGRELMGLLRKRGIDTGCILADAARPTTLKTRVIAHHQQVCRIDREAVLPASKHLLKFFVDRLKKTIPLVDAVCIEDYGKGMITPEIVHYIVKLAKRHGKVITVDPKEDNLSYYRGVSAITPNHHEASALSGIKIADVRTLELAGKKLLSALACDNVLITQGEHGMTLFQKGAKPVRIPTMAQDVFDVSGAGDTVIGTFTLARALHADPLDSAYLANCAAGVVVGKVGTAVVSREELLERVHSMVEKKISWKRSE